MEKVIQLAQGDHSVLVSSKGGSILQWKWREETILGPPRMVRVGGAMKQRGISHWCNPFGTVKPETGLNFPQHGSLRNTILDVALHSETSATFMKPPQLNDEWLMGHPEVLIGVHSCGVAALLSLRNESESPVPVLLGIHPYLAVPLGGITIMVGGRTIRGEDIPANSCPADDMYIKRGKSPIRVDLHGIGWVELETSADCSDVVVWSDHPQKYVCVEPVFGTPGSCGTEAGRWLDPRQKLQCGVNFRFEPAAC